MRYNNLNPPYNKRLQNVAYEFDLDTNVVTKNAEFIFKQMMLL